MGESTSASKVWRYSGDRRLGQPYIRRAMFSTRIVLQAPCGESREISTDDARLLARDLIAMADAIEWDRTEQSTRDERIKAALVEYLTPRGAAKAEGVTVAPLTFKAAFNAAYDAVAERVNRHQVAVDEPLPVPTGLAFLAEATLTQARMAQKQWGIASKMLVEGYGVDEHLAAVIDMLEEINAKIKENEKDAGTK